MTETLKDLLTSKWLWITIIGCIAATILPWYIIYFLLILPSPINVIIQFAIIIGWGIVAGYKDWQLYKKKEEEWVPGQEKARSREYPT